MDSTDLFDVMRTTGAVREYTDDAAARRGARKRPVCPSGGHRQGTHVVVLREQEIRDRLADLAIPGARRYIAQLRNGGGPWNPLQPCGADAETIVAAFDRDLDRIGVIPGASVYPFVHAVAEIATRERFDGEPFSAYHGDNSCPPFSDNPRTCEESSALSLIDSHLLCR